MRTTARLVPINPIKYFFHFQLNMRNYIYSIAGDRDRILSHHVSYNKHKLKTWDIQEKIGPRNAYYACMCDVSLSILKYPICITTLINI